ncbi:MAG: molybdopterin-dependent oxidoreductase [Candidatus Nanopelagicales bacterium]
MYPRAARAGAAALMGLVAALATASCASPPATDSPTATATPVATATATENPYGGAPVDPPGPGEAVLVVIPSSGPEVALTMAELESLGTRSVTLDEPFVHQRQEFTGVPLATVVEQAGIPASAEVVTRALNDYEYADTVADLVGSDALIATSRDGAAIPFDQGGPIRLVFPDGSALATNLDAWNWSLAEVRQA